MQEEVAHQGREVKMEDRDMRDSRVSKAVTLTVLGGGIVWA